MFVVILVDWLISEEFALLEFSRFVCDWVEDQVSRGDLLIITFFSRIRSVRFFSRFFDHNFFSSKVYRGVEIFRICVETKLRTQHKLRTSFLDGKYMLTAEYEYVCSQREIYIEIRHHNSNQIKICKRWKYTNTKIRYMSVYSHTWH